MTEHVARALTQAPRPASLSRDRAQATTSWPRKRLQHHGASSNTSTSASRPDCSVTCDSQDPDLQEMRGAPHG
jgi:hypothetical protein